MSREDPLRDFTIAFAEEDIEVILDDVSEAGERTIVGDRDIRATQLSSPTDTP